MNWPGRGKTRCLDDLPKIDVREWSRKGRTEPGKSFRTEWFSADKLSIYLAINVHVGYFGISGERKIGTDWYPIEAKVGRRFTPCNLGGRRIWFECRACGRRAALLYVDGMQICCRRCLDLPYRVQCENSTDRLLRRIQRVRKKLGAPGNLLAPVPPRKPYQRVWTYDKMWFEEITLRRELFERWKEQILEGYSVTHVYLDELKRGGTWDDVPLP